MLESRSLPREFKGLVILKLYAPPLFWSPWTSIAEATSQWAFKITATTESQAPSPFEAQVKYFDENGRQVVKNFGLTGSIVFKAGRPGVNTDAQQIFVRFRSVSIGQTVRVTVNQP